MRYIAPGTPSALNCILATDDTRGSAVGARVQFSIISRLSAMTVMANEFVAVRGEFVAGIHFVERGRLNVINSGA